MTQIRTFHPRRGRLSGRHRDALERLLPRYGIPDQGFPDQGFPDQGLPDQGLPDPSDSPATGGATRLGPADLFRRTIPMVVEIGSGMGEATAAMAAADPARGYLAVEIHTPGVANLLHHIEAGGLDNLRVATVDALELLRDRIEPDSLDAIHVFFPDPWPKARHHKRRLIQPSHVALLRSRLRPGGVLHCATDWAQYAEAMLATLAADPELVNPHGGYAPRPAHRPATKFEQRAVSAGRRSFDIIVERRS